MDTKSGSSIGPRHRGISGRGTKMAVKPPAVSYSANLASFNPDDDGCAAEATNACFWCANQKLPTSFPDATLARKASQTNKPSFTG